MPRTPGSGRRKGSANKATRDAREAIARFVESNGGRLQTWLDEIAETDGPRDRGTPAPRRATRSAGRATASSSRARRRLQAALAERTKGTVNQSDVTRVERGMAPSNAAQVAVLAGALSVDIETLLRRPRFIDRATDARLFVLRTEE